MILFFVRNASTTASCRNYVHKDFSSSATADRLSVVFSPSWFSSPNILGACAGGACATYEYQIQAFAGTPASYHRMGKAKAGIGFCEGLSSKLFLDNGQPVVEHDGFQPGCCAHEAQLYSPGTKAKLGKLR